MKILCILALSLFAVSSADEEKITYNGNQVFRVHAKTEAQAEALLKLREDTDVDFWTEISMVIPTDIMVKPEDINVFEQYMNKFEIEFETMIPNVQTLIDEEERTNLGVQGEVDWKHYNTLEEIYAWIDKTVADNKERVKISTESLGDSTEKRPLKVIKIGSGPKKVWLDAGIHAREWVTPATATWIIKELLSEANKELLTAYEWTILPVQNPDGYVHTRSARMWRKTRSKNPGSSCIGTDANRNWEYKWNTGGSSNNPCRETYMGPKAHSEPEVSKVADHMRNIKYHIAITIHSYSQLWMLPWAYTLELPADNDELMRGGNLAVAALKAVNGLTFRVGNIHKIIYKASGSSTDWMRGVAGAKYAYALELRDRGQHGFLLPPDQIIPAAKETWAGIQALAKDVKDKPSSIE